MKRAVLIGLGNRLRGDDAAGLEVARRAGELRPGLEAHEHETEPTGAIGLWQDAGVAVVVDALAPAGSPGRVVRIEVGPEGLPDGGERPTSTHAFGLAAAIELARSTSLLPERLIVYGIEGECFRTGIGMSGAVERAIGPTTARALFDLDGRTA